MTRRATISQPAASGCARVGSLGSALTRGAQATCEQPQVARPQAVAPASTACSVAGTQRRFGVAFVPLRLASGTAGRNRGSRRLLQPTADLAAPRTRGVGTGQPSRHDPLSVSDTGPTPADPNRPFDLSNVRTRPLAGRPTLVDVSRFGSLPPADARVGEFLSSLPDFLGARSLRALAGHIARASRGDHGVAAAMGGHVVKTGCSPIVLDLMERGIVTSLHMAGSTAIHDYEIACVGETSEDVAAGLGEGLYGMADETGRAFAVASTRARAEGVGLGRALGLGVLENALPHADVSLLAAAAKRELPCTVHVAIGTDTVHMHPDVDGADAGAATQLDFEIACSVVAGLDHGVWLNIGSAVILPEVFLKCVTVARNTGHPVEDLTTANFDMLRHYRPITNVVKRPPARGYDIAGHHEIMLPLLRMAVLAALADGSGS